MTKKTYFKGKKKSVKPKKYVFAGFDESTMDNTQLLNALYNPNYYGTQQPADTTATKENISQNVQLSQTAAMNIQGAKESTTDAISKLQQVKTDAEAAEKKQLTEMNEASKTQAVTSAGSSLLTGLGEIGKTYLPAAAAKASTTAVVKPPANLLTKFGTPPSSKIMNFKVPGAESIGEQGLKNSIGSTTWSTPGAAAAAAGIGIAASVGGSLWDNLSEDADPYTYSRKEKWGDWGGNILSETGKWGSVGATVGGPLGALIGGVAGVGIGAFKAARESKQNKKMAQEMTAERDRQQAEYRRLMNEYQSNLDKQQRIYDYNKRRTQENIVMGEEQLRQNRLQYLTESQLSGNTSIAMTGGGRKYFGKGGVSVPGGQVVPIGQGAVEFVGRKHSQGGIKLDAKTEVEGGETMDKVKMKNGKMNDYFFSEFLKYKGKSFAKRHKDLVKKGASQKEIQALAKKQEAMANRRGEKDRSPKQVAEYGGLRQYQTGNFKETADAVKESDGVYRVRDAQGNILAESSDKNVAEKRAQNVVIAASSMSDSNPRNEPFTWQSFPPYDKETSIYKNGYERILDDGRPWNEGYATMGVWGETPNAANYISESPYKTAVGPIAEEAAASETPVENTPYFQKVMANYKKELSSGNAKEAKKIAEQLEKEKSQQLAKEKDFRFYQVPAEKGKEKGNYKVYELPKGKQKVDKDFRFYENPGVRGKGTEEKKYTPMYTEQQLRNARILAGVGFGSQLIAPVASLFMKPKLVDAPKAITPQLLDASIAAKSVPQMISAGTVTAPRLGRIAPQTEDILNRSAATKQFMANMGDPSAMVGMIASDTRAAEAERKEMQRAQEANTELAGKEGMLKFEASKANVASNLEAQRANQAAVSEAQSRYLNVLSQNQNAQNQAYIANLDNQTRVALANAQLRADKQNRDILAMSTFGSNIAGGVGDLFSYSIEDAKARAASGDTGVYGANFIPIFGTRKPDDNKKTGGVKKKMYGGTNSYTSRLGDLKFKRALKAK